MIFKNYFWDLFLNLKNTDSISIAAHLHGPELKPIPIGVEVRRANEREVDAQIAVRGRAVDAQEHAVRHRGPRWVLRTAVEADLKNKQILNLSGCSYKKFYQTKFLDTRMYVHNENVSKHLQSWAPLYTCQSLINSHGFISSF